MEETTSESKRLSSSDLQSKIQMKVDEADKDMYVSDVERRYRTERRNRTLIIMAVCLAAVYILSLLLPTSLFLNENITLARYLEGITERAGNLGIFLGGGNPDFMFATVIQLFLVALTGGALSVSGTVYQGAFRNAMASPTTLGVEVGGVLGGTVYILLFTKTSESVYETSELLAANQSLLEKYGQTMAVFGGCFLVVMFVLTVAKLTNGGKITTVNIILSGTIIAGAIGEVMSLIEYDVLMDSTFSTKANLLRYLLMGTFNNVFTADYLILLGVPVIAIITAIMFMRNRLNLLVFGEDEALAMGINVGRIRTVTVILVTMLTAVSISFCGMIGFMGFIVPHMARKFVGPDFRYLLPASGLLGGICMMFIFHMALVLNMSLYINVITSVIGGIVFIAMAIWFRSRGNADWA